MVDHLLRDVAVQIQRQANRYTGCGGAHSCQQIALTIRAVLGHHGAVQVEQDGVAPVRGADDALGQRVVGRGMHLAAGVGHGRHRRDQRGTQPFGQVDEGSHGGAHALVVKVGRIAVGGREGFERRGDGREGIGLVVQPGNKNFYATTPALRSMACSNTLQPASRCSGCASSISL